MFCSGFGRVYSLASIGCHGDLVKKGGLWFGALQHQGLVLACFFGLPGQRQSFLIPAVLVVAVSSRRSSSSSSSNSSSSSSSSAVLVIATLTVLTPEP